jgi:U3 small nucleolar RNA-associated protein 15
MCFADASIILSDFSPGHTDYVRCGFESPSNPNLWVSGSYDHTLRVWDTRAPPSEQCVMMMDHGAPIQDALFLPMGSLLISAGTIMADLIFRHECALWHRIACC